MRRLLRVGVLLAAGTVVGRGQAPASNTWDKLVAANDLGMEGKKPFHLAMTFQLYDLSGKPAETGSLDTWWSGPGRERTEVHLAGLNEDGSAPEGADAALVRDAILVRYLVALEIDPLPKMGTVTGLTTKPTKFGKVELDCISPQVDPAQEKNARIPVACVAARTMQAQILEVVDGKVSVIRPRMGTFQETHVALESKLGFVQRDAIAGTVTLLQTDAAAKGKAEGAAASPVHQEMHLLGGVDGGHRIKFVEPIYPLIGKGEHRSGTVVMDVIVGVDGQVRSLVPIAITNTIFTSSAMEAVKQWRFTPYLLNGVPAEMETTITVNFQTSGG